MRFDEKRYEEVLLRDDLASVLSYCRAIRSCARGLALAFVASNFLLMAAHADAASKEPKRAAVKKPVVIPAKPPAKGEEVKVSPYVLANKRHMEALKAQAAATVSRPVHQANTPVARAQ